MVRRWLYDDDEHRIQRDRQRKYDREIRAIREEHKCSRKEAQDIRMEKLREEARKHLKEKKGVK